MIYEVNHRPPDACIYMYTHIHVYHTLKKMEKRWKNMSNYPKSFVNIASNIVGNCTWIYDICTTSLLFQNKEF